MLVDGKPVTWAEVLENRRIWQRERLRRKREWCVNEVRAYRISVAYFDQDLMGGWQAMIEDWRGRGYSIWIDRDARRLEPHLMRLFPLILPVGSEHDQWQAWKPAFARQFERRRHDRQPQGVAYFWWDGRDSLRSA